jgi:CHAT domain-containing protein
VASVLVVQGQVSIRTGSYEDALEQLGRAQKILQAIHGPEHYQVADIQAYLAEIALQTRQHAEAAHLYRQVLAVHRKVFGAGHSRVLASRHNLAHALTMGGKYAEALSHYAAVLEGYEGTLGSSHPWTTQSRCTLALVKTMAGQPEEALPECQRCLADLERSLGKDHIRIAQNMQCLSLAQLRLEKTDQARKTYQKTLAVISKNIDPLLDVISTRERQELIAARRAHLDKYLTFHDRPGDSFNAYRETLRWKGLAMTTLAAQQEAALASRDPALRGILGKLNRVRRELAELSFTPPTRPDQKEPWIARVVALTKERDALERTLSEKSPPIRVNRRVLAAGPREVCRGLGRGEALVDFLAYRRYQPPAPGQASEGTTSWHYLAYVLHAGRCKTPERIELGEAAPIDRAVERFLRLIQSRSRFGRLQRQGRRLWKRIWRPVSASVKGSTKIWIVPDSDIARVPMGALVDDQDRFLVESTTFGYLSTAQELVRPPRTGARSATRGALVVGDVDYGPLPPGSESRSAGSGILPVPALPGTGAEVDGLAGLLTKSRRGTQVVLLKGPQATEARVKQELSGKRIVHLATHGFFAPDQAAGVVQTVQAGPFFMQTERTFEVAAFSGLILAGANRPANVSAGEDGLLTAEEVSSLDLRETDLVTLSACETGVGRPLSGEGVLGLRKAFFVAGARSMLMSLWKVPDQETRLLMDTFYGRAVRSRLRGKARALRQAKLALIRSLREKEGEAHPLFWAAFIVSGR